MPRTAARLLLRVGRCWYVILDLAIRCNQVAFLISRMLSSNQLDGHLCTVITRWHVGFVRYPGMNKGPTLGDAQDFVAIRSVDRAPRMRRYVINRAHQIGALHSLGSST